MELKDNTPKKLTARERLAFRLILIAIEIIHPMKYSHKWNPIKKDLLDELDQ